MDCDTDFKMAANQELTCSDCKYCQINMKVKNVRIGYLCMRQDTKQTGYYSSSWKETDAEYLCNKFEFHDHNDPDHF